MRRRRPRDAEPIARPPRDAAPWPQRGGGRPARARGGPAGARPGRPRRAAERSARAPPRRPPPAHLRRPERRGVLGSQRDPAGLPVDTAALRLRPDLHDGRGRERRAARLHRPRPHDVRVLLPDGARLLYASTHHGGADCPPAPDRSQRLRVAAVRLRPLHVRRRRQRSPPPRRPPPATTPRGRSRPTGGSSSRRRATATSTSTSTTPTAGTCGGSRTGPATTAAPSSPGTAGTSSGADGTRPTRPSSASIGRCSGRASSARPARSSS